MEKTEPRNPRRAWTVVLAVLALFAAQELIGKAGSAVANLFAYGAVDPDGAYAWQSVHHLVLLAAALAAVAVLRRPLNDRFGFEAGDRIKGMRFVGLFTAAMAAIAILYHLSLRLGGGTLTYGYPLNAGNILGSLGFQLLLSGPAEEILYRALPVTVLLHALGRSVKIRGSVTLEIVIASLLFSAAHVKWTLSPFGVEADLFQLVYAFAVGTVQGVAYRESRSVLYPILMHSLSNVLMVGTGYLFAILA